MGNSAPYKPAQGVFAAPKMTVPTAKAGFTSRVERKSVPTSSAAPKIDLTRQSSNASMGQPRTSGVFAKPNSANANPLRRSVSTDNKSGVNELLRQAGKPAGGLGSLEPNISRGMGNAGLSGLKRPAPVSVDEPFVKRMRHQEGAPGSLFSGRSFQRPPPMGAQPVSSGFPKTAAVRPGPVSDPMTVSPPPPR